MRSLLLHAVVSVLCGFMLCQCGTVSQRGELMGGPTLEQREQAIAGEATGDFYYGRRYYVEKTRFWGYLREPRQPWRTAKLVMMLEDRKHVPDRLPEDGPEGRRYGYDQNHEYRIWGRYTGRRVYDPNSNQILPEFQLTDWQLVNESPGWIFSPEDRYHPQRVNLLPRSR